VHEIPGKSWQECFFGDGDFRGVQKHVKGVPRWRWRWYKSPDLYQYQHVSDVYLLNIFALRMRQRRENVGTSLETCTS
jgi:hypothetical protein